MRIVGNDGKLIDGEFEEVRRNRAIVVVRDVKTKKVLSVHNSRLRKAGSEGEDMAKKKVVGVPVDWKKVQGERWARRIKFDHSDIVAEANVIIDAGKSTYRTFNTYNGSLGGDLSLPPNEFKFADYEKLVYKLKKKGYARRSSARQDAPVSSAPAPESKPEQA